MRHVLAAVVFDNARIPDVQFYLANNYNIHSILIHNYTTHTWPDDQIYSYDRCVAANFQLDSGYPNLPCAMQYGGINHEY